MLSPALFYRVQTGEDVIIFKEKHGSTSFRYFNREDLRYACLTILKRREKECPFSEQFDDIEPTAPETVSDEVLASLPVGHRKDIEGKETIDAHDYRQRLRYWKQSKRIVELTPRAMGDDGEAAIKIIELRGDLEYEGYKIISLNSTDAQLLPGDA